jgi:hypothetical protein
MSGFEIVGVILGALPLAIEGAKAYGKAVSIASLCGVGVLRAVRFLPYFQFHPSFFSSFHDLGHKYKIGDSSLFNHRC